MLYLDHNSTTFTHTKVKDRFIELINGGLNPSSIHTNGRYGKKLIELAREQIKNSLAIAEPSREFEVTFTSSGTESNNLIMHNYSDGDIFISAIEHLSIYNHIKYNSNIKVIKVDNNGIIDQEHLLELLSKSTSNKKLISVMLANNETGVIQDLATISKIAQKYGALLHSDCVQAFGKIEVNVKDLGFDFCTISAHKIGGIQGSAALIANSKHILRPMIIGGGQEKNLRSGTENVASISCFGLAAEIMTSDLQKNAEKMQKMQKFLEENLQKYKNVKIIGKGAQRLPNTTLIIIPNSDAQTKLIALDLRNIYISSGSACSSGKIGKSHVLANMGISLDEARSSIRISLNHDHTLEEIEFFIQAFEEIYKQELT